MDTRELSLDLVFPPSLPELPAFMSTIETNASCQVDCPTQEIDHTPGATENAWVLLPFGIVAGALTVVGCTSSGLAKKRNQ